uniref:2,3-bisphosphoglycerate-independent phosphoglycerate mutase n=1 Tax=Boldia erythrosiphon TaxID=74908 RepID=A0A1Y9TLS8_9RHOD|nr:2 3-bisphosphoglycerate independent phosphoglycerate mutase [Boldia erythrosiphon]ARO90565.1 2 3-bisphosphoglycerate independent phosphoglycerate mutase [Boldia erythrosiphon]
MSTRKVYPTVLTILDGWGASDNSHGNAVRNANTPVLNALLSNYPVTFLHCSGKHVGLPDKQMGNSEVGHVTMGGGRIIPQDLVKIAISIEDYSFFSNPVLHKACKKVEHNDSSLHIIGLCSNGGVHSHIDHLFSLIDLARQKLVKRVCLHIITDGRDTPPFSGINFVERISNYIKEDNHINIVTITGRYYAMDRDSRWARTEQAYNIFTNDENTILIDPVELIAQYYNKSISDEFIVPSRVNKGAIKSGDAIIFFNYRPDRMRQLAQAFSKSNFKGFSRERISDLLVITFTQYDSLLDIPFVFKPNKLTNFLGEIVSKNNLKQFRIAETEKYAHVTYFFNGGIEEPFLGEDRELVPSPKVATYDITPAMSALQVTQKVIKALEKNCYSLIIINYANPDMLGHTGNYEATIAAMETVDKCIGQLLENISKFNGLLILTADHGNAECMLDENNNPHTSHTNNRVPFLLIEGEMNKITGHGGQVHLKKEGSLIDIAPTILDILKLQKPLEMTGTSLIELASYEIR